MVFCYVLPPSAYNRAVTAVLQPGWGLLPCLHSRPLAPTNQLLKAASPHSSPLPKSRLPQDNIHSPCRRSSSLLHHQSFYFKGTQLAFLVHSWYLEAESGSVRFQDPIPLLETLRPEQPDSRLMEEWISSQTFWTPAPAAWQQGGQMLNPLVVQRGRQSSGLGFPWSLLSLRSPACPALPFLVPAGLKNREYRNVRDLPVGPKSHGHYFPRIWKTLGLQHG